MKYRFGCISSVLTRCWFRLMMICVGAAAIAAPAIAEDAYPSYPIQLVVPFAAGGNFDTMGRVIAEQLAKIIHGSIIVINKAGAGGMIGGAFVAKAKPDGYTLLLGGPGTLSINPNLAARPPYDPERSFTPIAYIGATPYFLVTRPEVAPTIQALIEKAKRAPGKLTYSSPGVGSNLNLTMELFKLNTGTKIVHIPYAGTGPAITDLVAGRVDMTVAPELVLPQVHAGKLVALAVTTTNRSQLMPSVPTLKEAGVEGVDSSGWYGVLAPAGTPKAITDKLNAALNQMLNTPEFRKYAAESGLEIGGGPAETLGQKVAQDSAKWSNVIKVSGITPK